MTNEQAAECLKTIHVLSFKDETATFFLTDVQKAFKLAIQALEQQPSEDCISRQAVKEMLREEWTKYIPMELDINLSFVLEKINELPSVTPQQTRWVPVSERLPEKHDCYLVTTKWKGSYSGDVYTETNMAVYREKLEEWDSVGVIAWMPLPEPYKVESEDKE